MPSDMNINRCLLWRLSFSICAIVLASVQISQGQTPPKPQIAFASDRTGRLQLYTVQPDPLGAVDQLTFAGSGGQESRAPDWSRFGKIAYQFGASGVRGIHVIDADGTNDQRLTFSTTDERDPSWSPDGKFIVYASNESGNYDLWIHDVASTNDYELLIASGIQTRPSWSPDGKWIAYVSNEAGDNEIMVVPVRIQSGTVILDGSAQSKTTNSDNDFNPCWSPDSLHIAFQSTRGGNTDIYRMDLATGEASLMPLTTHAASDSNPAWSPDASTIAFVSDRDGNSEIYVMSAGLGEADVASLRRITNDGGQDLDPAWEPQNIIDIVAVGLAWNNTTGALDARYRVDNGALTNATTAKLFWANGTSTNNILSTTPIVSPETIPPGTGGPDSSSVITFNVPASSFTNPPPGATHILLALDYDNLLQEPNETNNAITVEIRSMELVDALTFQQGGVLPTDLNQYFSGGQSRAGAVADGASRLVLRVNLGTIDTTDPGLNLRFTVSGAGSQGRLRPLSSDTWSSDVAAALATQSATTKALCIYESPADFPDSSPTASVQLLNGTSVIATKQIQIKRPPLVLVHGIWSSKDEAWIASGAAGYIESQIGPSQNGFAVAFADYRSSNSEGFEKNALYVFGSVLVAISDVRAQSYACSQVDIVTHSMGGLLSRLMAQRYGRQSENYSKGIVHKLITVGTPHRGCFVADELVYVWNFHPIRYDLLRRALSTQDKFIEPGGAAFNLSSYRSIAGQNISGIPTIEQVPIPSHAIIGTATRPTVFSDCLNPFSDLWTLYSLLLWFIWPVDPHCGLSDGMVLNESQAGGLSSAVTYITESSTPHTSETSNGEFQAAAARLLRASVTSSASFASAGFPHYNGVPFSSFRLASKNSLLGDTNTDWLEIISPTNGQAVSVGEQITFSVRAKDGRLLKAVGIFGLSESVLLTNAPYQTFISVPQDSIGVLDFAVLANDTTNQLGYSAVSLKVTTTASLNSIIVKPSQATLRFALDTGLQVLGVFSDGIQRDITSAAADTKYGSSDPLRVRVHTNGVLKAIQNTTTPVTISITNGTIWTNLQVTVDLINLPPNAVISTDLTNATGRAPISIQFNASLSSDPEFLPLSYQWDFGDGTTSDQQSPPRHTFSVPGDYVVRLVVSDPLGLNGTSEFLVKVAPAVLLEIHYMNGQPRVTLFGEPGKPHILEGSTDFQNWIPLITNSPVGGSFEFMDTNFTDFRQRFYRGVKP